MRKLYYALYDFITKPNCPGYGTNYTKLAMAFTKKADRDTWLEARESFDYSAQPISRKEAKQLKEPIHHRPGEYGVFILPKKFVSIGAPFRKLNRYVRFN